MAVFEIQADIVCRWPRDQSTFAGVNGGSAADGTALQDGEARRVTHLLDMPRERMECCVSVWTQRVLQVC